jgi:hypothetical protein
MFFRRCGRTRAAAVNTHAGSVTKSETLTFVTLSSKFPVCPPLPIYKSQGFLFAKYAVWVAAAPEATGLFVLPHICLREPLARERRRERRGRLVLLQSKAGHIDTGLQA